MQFRLYLNPNNIESILDESIPYFCNSSYFFGLNKNSIILNNFSSPSNKGLHILLKKFSYSSDNSKSFFFNFDNIKLMDAFMKLSIKLSSSPTISLFSIFLS